MGSNSILKSMKVIPGSTALLSPLACAQASFSPVLSPGLPPYTFHTVLGSRERSQ